MADCKHQILYQLRFLPICTQPARGWLHFDSLCLNIVCLARRQQTSSEKKDSVCGGDPSTWTLVPVGVQLCMTEEETAWQSLWDRAVPWLRDRAEPWPGHDHASAISEFSTKATLSFPTLLLTRAANYLAPRQYKIMPGNYTKHLMIYHDGRFPNTHNSDIWLWTVKCIAVHYKMAGYTVANTRMLQD